MAIIEAISLDFNEKMTVLTGETGAGKSIIIDSISLLLGGRASTEIIRHNEEKAIIEAVFNVPIKGELQRFLEDNDLDYDETDGLVIKRVIKRTGSSQIRLNGQLVSANQLKALGELLVDIHLQHDSLRLFSPEMYYRLLDNLVKNEKVTVLRQGYLDALADYQRALVEYRNFQTKSQDVALRLFKLEDEVAEFDRAQLRQGELEELLTQQAMLASAEDLHLLFGEIMAATTADGQALELLYPLIDAVEHLVKINAKFEPFLSQIRDVYYNLEDFTQMISREKSQLTFDPQEFEQIETRISDLRRLERKYQLDITELIKYEAQIRAELANFLNAGDHEEDLLSEVRQTHKRLIERGESLNEARVMIANKVKTALIKELDDLKLPNTQFDIAFNRLNVDDALNSNFSSNGLYVIDLLLSTNKGEPLKPINKVASGGELSRIMLALKSILNRGQQITTIIFDEIDSGVSGQVATSIGAKMQEIAAFKQVLCITHLPQVASYAQHHLHVSKVDNNEKTLTKASYLEGEARVHEIAVMMSDETVTQASLENARQMLQSKVVK